MKSLSWNRENHWLQCYSIIENTNAKYWNHIWGNLGNSLLDVRIAFWKWNKIIGNDRAETCMCICMYLFAIDHKNVVIYIYIYSNIWKQYLRQVPNNFEKVKYLQKNDTTAGKVNSKGKQTLHSYYVLMRTCIWCPILAI